MFVGGFSCLCLLSPVARTHAARPHRDWKTQGRVQRSSPPLQAPHATSARVNRWRSPRAGWLSLCLSPTMGERCHSPFTSAELAAVSPVPRSIGARCGSSSCAAGLSTPAAAALRFVVRREPARRKRTALPARRRLLGRRWPPASLLARAGRIGVLVSHRSASAGGAFRRHRRA